MHSRHLKLLAAATLTAWSLTAGLAHAAGVLTIGCREDSTTFDPIKSAQNRDTWVFANVYDTLVRVDNLGTKMEPGLAESWDISKDRRSLPPPPRSACCASATTRPRCGATRSA